MELAQVRPLTSRTRVALAIARGIAAARGDRDLTETHITAGEQEVLRLSDLEADQLNDPFLGTEHILLAILRSNDRVAKRFSETGMSLEKYQEGLASSCRGDPPPSSPRAV